VRRARSLGDVESIEKKHVSELRKDRYGAHGRLSKEPSKKKKEVRKGERAAVKGTERRRSAIRLEMEKEQKKATTRTSAPIEERQI